MEGWCLGSQVQGWRGNFGNCAKRADWGTNTLTPGRERIGGLLRDPQSSHLHLYSTARAATSEPPPLGYTILAFEDFVRLHRKLLRYSLRSVGATVAKKKPYT